MKMTSTTDRRQQEEQSLDLVKRLVISALIFVVMGMLATMIGAYLAFAGDEDLERNDIIGLWTMTGVIGLCTAGGILLVTRRRPYSPWVVLGLLPMAICAFYIFG
jgi:hypothetical protein